MNIPMKDDGVTPDFEANVAEMELCFPHFTFEEKLAVIKALYTQGRASMQDEAAKVANRNGRDGILSTRGEIAQDIMKLKP